MSQKFDLGPSFYFMSKEMETFYHFLQLNFLDFIEYKIGPK